MSTEKVLAFIEIPKGGRNKYEYDPAHETLRLDRVLYSPLHYPTDYGFIVDTVGQDGDHLDVLIFGHEPAIPGSLLEVRPIGVLDMVDEKGPDQKILAVPVGDPRFDELRELDDLPGHWRREIQHFFEVYKALENKPTEILGWKGAKEARALVASSRRSQARQRVSSGAPWEATVGYSRAVRIGKRVVVSGTVAADGDGSVVGPGDPYIQTRYILQVIARALNEAGASFEDVVRTRIYVTEIKQWEEVGRAHGEIFGRVRPATTMVQVAALIRPEFLVEIEADAVVD